MGSGSKEHFIEVREKYAKGEIDRAAAWVEKTFERFVEPEGTGRKKHNVLYIHRFVITPHEIEVRGAREDREGWYHAQHVDTRNLAMLYIHIILDESIPDEDKIDAIAEYDEGVGHGYGPYFQNYPNEPYWYVLPWEEINRRKAHYKKLNEEKAKHTKIILDPLTSEEAKREAREALGIP